MAHAGYEIEAAPGADLIIAAVGFRHALVVINGVLRREPRIAVAVVEEQLTVVAREGVEVRPARGCVERFGRIVAHAVDSRIDIHANVGEPGSDGRRSAMQKASDALR